MNPSVFLTADANGNIPRAGEGYGFSLMPGRAAASKTVRPGSFPVAVVTKLGKRIEVIGPHAYYFRDLGEEPGAFKIECGADGAGEGWNVVTFADPTDGVRSGARGSRLTTRIQSAAAMPTAAPVGAVGFKVRPGTIGWQVTAGGTLATARIWIRDLDDVWTDTLEDLDLSLNPVIGRLADAVGRIYLQAAAANMTAAIDVTDEVG